MITLSQLYHMPGTKHDELAAGVLVVREPCHAGPSVVNSMVYDHVHAFVSRHHLGLVTTDPAGYILARDPDTVRCPDVGFITARRLEDGIPEGFFDGPPDLAIEVVSNSDRVPNVMRKVGEYLQAGTQIVWVIYPKTKSAAVFHENDETSITIPPDGTFDGEDVLPGFQLPLRELFRGFNVRFDPKSGEFHE